MIKVYREIPVFKFSDNILHPSGYAIRKIKIKFESKSSVFIDQEMAYSLETYF